MEYVSRQCVYTLIFGFVWIIAVTSGATGEKKFVKEVEMKLYQVSKGDWDSTGQEEFSKILAEKANTYCEEDTDPCFMKMDEMTVRFDSDDYEEISSAKDKAYLKVVFAMALPGNEKDREMLPGHEHDTHLINTTLAAITTNAVEKFREDSDMAIVEIGEEAQALPPDNTLNIAISVTAVAILLIMIAVLLIMQYKCGGHEHELLAQKEEAANNRGDDDDKKAARGGTVATLQSVVTDDQLPAKKQPADVQTTDM